ncbi:MAG: hypothetical protein GX279_00005 [Clostridiaceae bacterium]|jgi:hypothetical protein|nr:hypothetical protein [Clostridiaceae bacterium]
MGRNYSRKPARDVEAASETLIPPELGSSILKKKNEMAPTMPVSSSLDSSPVFDDFPDKRTL